MVTKNFNHYCDLCWICEAVAKAENRESLMSKLAEGLLKLLNAKASFVRILNQARTHLDPGVWFGLSEEDVTGIPRSLKENKIDASVLARDEIITVEDARKDPRWKGQSFAKQDGFISLLAAPMCVSERCIGTLHLYFDSPHEFSERELCLVRTVCGQAAAALWRILLQRQSDVMSEISRDISSSLEVANVLENITRNATEVLMFKAASIRILDEDGEHLEERSVYGLSKEYLRKGPIKLQFSPIDKDVLKGKTITVNEEDFDEKLEYPDEVRKEGIRSILCLPLKIKDRPVGVLRVYTATPYRFDQSEVRFLSTLANYGAMAIENARLFEHLQRDYQDLTRAVWKWYDWGERPPAM